MRLLTAILGALLACLLAPAAALASPAHTTGYWNAETCHDLTLYKQGDRPFAMMYRASEHAGLFLSIDVSAWRENRILRMSRVVLDEDRAFTDMDCEELAEGTLPYANTPNNNINVPNGS
jgi:hypothetical protein